MRYLYFLLLISFSYSALGQNPRATSSHPRLYLTPEIITSLKTRATNNTPEWKLLKDRTQTGLSVDKLLAEYEGYHYAFTYALSFMATNNESHRDIAVQLFKGEFNNDMKDSDMCEDDGYNSRGEMVDVATLYDWLYAYLDEPFRASVRARLIKWTNVILGIDKSACSTGYAPYGIWPTAGYDGTYFFEGNNYTVGHLVGITSVAYAIYSEDQTNANRLLAEVDKILPKLITFSNTRLKYGDANEGWGYGAGYALNFFRVLAIIKTASYDHHDYFKETTYDEDAIRFLVHATLPDKKRMLAEGDWARESTGKIWDYHRFVAEMVSSYSDSPEATKVARFWANECLPLDDMEVTAYRYQPFLTANQEVIPVDYRTLDDYQTNHFTTESGTAQFLQRTGWDDNTQWVSFKASPRYGDHAHNGPGHFSIYENGWLIIDRNILTSSGIEGADSMHNCIHYQGMNASPYYQNQQHSIFERSEINTDYTYFRVNTTPEYTIRQSNIVKKSERQFLYLPSVKSIVLFDIAETNAATKFKAFGVNFNGAPTVNGSVISYSNDITKVNVHSLYPTSAAITAKDVLVRVQNKQSNAKDYFVNLIYTQPKGDPARAVTTLSTETSNVLYSSARGTQFIADGKSYAVLSASDDASGNGVDSMVYAVPVASLTENYIVGMTPSSNYYATWEPYVSPNSSVGFSMKVILSKKNRSNATLTTSTAAGTIHFEIHIDNVVTGLPEKQDLLKIYPNPVTDKLIIQRKGTDLNNLDIVTSDGRTLPLSYQSYDDRLEMNVETLPEGIYVLRGINNSQTFSYKFLKKNH